MTCSKPKYRRRRLSIKLAFREFKLVHELDWRAGLSGRWFSRRNENTLVTIKEPLWCPQSTTQACRGELRTTSYVLGFGLVGTIVCQGDQGRAEAATNRSAFFDSTDLALPARLRCSASACISPRSCRLQSKLSTRVSK